MADTKKNNQIRSSNLLPKFYQTDANKKFLHATVEQLTQSGTVTKVNGYVGRQNAKATKGADIFLDELTQSRQDYQLEPSLVIKDDLDNTTFFKDYSDYINQLGVFEGDVSNHSRLNKQEFYSWDPHINWDKFVNFQNYYWLPYGPDAINVAGQQQEITSTYEVIVESEGDSNAYIFSPKGSVGLTRNPTIKLYKGQTYKFDISSPGNPFSIKTQRTNGIFDRFTTGVDNFAVTSGTITFTVPYDSPDVLFYVSESDIDLGGIFEVLSITENTSINIDEEILGKKTYTMANGISLSNGMKIKFVGDVTPVEYATGMYYVEGVGDSIKLVNESILELVSQYTVAETVLFDGVPFDSLPFADASAYAGTPDYVVINRSSKDHNPWSRYNRWFHKDVIEISANANEKIPSLDQNARAVRPIVEFEPDLRLFNFGTQAIADVDLIDSYTTDVFSFVEGQLGYNIDGIQLAQDQRVLFTADTDILVKNKIYRVNFITVQDPLTSQPVRQLHLILDSTPVDGDVVLVRQGVNNQGLMYWFDGESWNFGQQKTLLNQSPLYDIVDENQVSYGNTSVYDGSTFKGTKIFSYKVGTGTVDSNLGFPLSYKNINNIGDIVFNFNLATDTYQYKDVANIVTKTVNNGFLIKTINSTTSYVNGWQVSKLTNVQPGIRIYKNSGLVNDFPIDLYDNPTDLSDLVIKVYVNGIRLDQIDPLNVAVPQWTIVDGIVNKSLVLKTDISTDDVLTIKAFASQPINSNGYYEIPINLQNNPLNGLLVDFTLGEVIDHVNSIVENAPGFIGSHPGANNTRDLGNITCYGTKFVQHSGPLSLAMYHITSDTNNVIRAIERARSEYNKFKKNFIAIAEALGVDTDPVTQVDLILQRINKDKPNTFPYYFSDMVPYGAKIKNDYTVIDYRIKTYPISTTFNLDSLSSNAVLVYHTDANNEVTQLLYGRDYTFSDQGFVVISSTIATNDTITIHEFDNTNGSFVPATPTKLGLWPKYQPKMFVNSALVTPRTMIQGHDGSQILAYDDYRDGLLLELEKRIYNNIKVNYDASIFDIHDLIPGYNRPTDYSLAEFNQILAPTFYKWTTLIDRDFTKPLTYDRENTLTFNYRGHEDPSGYETLGYWRGIYRWMFDTDRPNMCPWEMLGLSEEPSWWQSLYGPAPYTSDNLILWQDLSEGVLREPGKPVVRLEKYARPFLMDHIPVNEYGEIISPIDCGIANGVITQSTEGDFVFGDVSPVEAAWRTSSYYPFSVIISALLMQPAKTFGVLLDRSRIIRDLSGQLVYKDTGRRVTPSDIVLPSIYSSSTTVRTSGIINYIVDYILSDNLKSYSGYQADLKALSANLSYRIGGFTSKEKFRFILDSKTPLSSSTVFIPQEDYSIILNKSSPIKKITYSGVIITKVSDGFEIKGYSKSQPYFKYYPWIKSGPEINVGGISESYSNWAPGETYNAGSIVKYNKLYYRTSVTHIAITAFNFEYFDRLSALPVVGGKNAIIRKAWDRTETVLIPYGTKFRDLQEIVDFLLGYGEWLKDQGFVFDEFNPTLGVITNWETSAKEFLFWTTQNWSAGEDKWKEWSQQQPVEFGSIVRYNGDYYRAIRTIEITPIFDTNDYIKLDGLSTIGSSVISLSPAATKLTFSTPLSVVDDIRNSFNGYEIFAVDGLAIAPNFLNSYRENNLVSYIPKSDSGIYCATFFLVQHEQVVVFNNSTMFNDTIYNLESGYRQERIRVSGYSSSTWDGSFNAPGFIFDQAKIQEWVGWSDYNLGDIVKYKEFYYSAKTFLVGSETFNMNDWVKLDQKPTAQLLPNWTYKASQFEDFYSLDSDNFDADQQTVAQHLIGYQKRQYLDNIIKDDVSEYKFYQGMITEKGTQNVLNKLFDVLSASNKESVDFFEEWAVRVGQYGASCAFESIEFVLDESNFKSNPQGFELVNVADPTKVDFIIRQTPNDLYLKPIGYNSNPWEINVNAPEYLRSPGYARLSDVKVAITTIDQIVNYDPTEFNFGDYVWCGFEQHEWNVYRVSNSYLVVTGLDYVNNELSVTVEGLVTQTVGTYIAFIDPAIKGFYKIKSVTTDTFVVDAVLVSGIETITDFTSIIIFELTSQRLSSINDANSIDVIGNGELIWTDDAGGGKWATWEYNEVYSQTEFLNVSPQTTTIDNNEVIIKFGKEVLINKDSNIAVITNTIGEIITYDKASINGNWVNRDTIVPPFISEPIGFVETTGLELIGDVLAISDDNKWLAVSTSQANNACTKYVGEWQALTSYDAGDIVFNGLNFYEAQSTIRLTLTNPVTAPAGAFVLQIGTGAYGYLEEAATASNIIILSQTSVNSSFDTIQGLIINGDDAPSTLDLTTVPTLIETVLTVTNVDPVDSTGYWKKVYYVPTTRYGNNSTLTNQGVVSIYEKDKNNIFTLVNTIISPLPVTNEYFGSSLAFGDNVLFVGATGNDSQRGKVYQLEFLDRVEVTSYYNPIGSSNDLITVSNTKGILPGMKVRGVGFSTVHVVDVVVDETTLFLNTAPDSEPQGKLEFYVSSWGYSESYKNELETLNLFGISPATTAGAKAGYSLAVSKDSQTLVISAPGTTQPGKVYVYGNQEGIFVLQQDPIVGTNVRYGESITISDTGLYLAISSIDYDGFAITRGIVEIYKYNSSTSQYGIVQTLTNKDADAGDQFGTKIFFMNDYTTLVVYSKNAETYNLLTFTDGTTFDNQLTRFIEQSTNSGRVDVYDRYDSSWIYSESLGIDITVTDNFGSGISVGDNYILVGAQNALDGSIRSGKVFEYRKLADAYTWSKVHEESEKINVQKIKRAFLYNKTTSKIVSYIDVLDASQGKIPGIADQEIKFKTFYDPAVYSVGTSDVNVDDGMAWSTMQVGSLWWDLRTAKFIESYSTDIVYKNNTWNQLFPGASIDVYEWVESSLLPDEWDAEADTDIGLTDGISGTSLYGADVYSVVKKYDNISKTFKNTYYYWVKNKKTIPNLWTRKMSASEVATLIGNPRGAGYKYIGITGSNSFSIVNAKPLLQEKNVVLAVEYWKVDNIEQSIHTQWKIINNSSTSKLPQPIEQKWFDSLCGKDQWDRLVPDMTLPPKIRYGVENRPRQSMYINRYEALKQLFERVNRVLITQQIADQRDLSKLETYDAEPSIYTGLYDIVLDTDLELRFAGAATFVNPILTTTPVNGKITSVTIVNKGNGYKIAPYIEVVGSGEGAVIRANINEATGQITGVTILNPGKGYDSSTVLVVRSYSVLVHSDTQANGGWSIYSYDVSTRVWSRILSQSYDTRNYWSFVDWFATGYNSFTSFDYSVESFADLNSIESEVGKIVKIRTTNSGRWMILKKKANSSSIDWTQSYDVVGLQNGTIQFSPSIYQYTGSIYGYDGTLYDSSVFDNVASVEVRYILNALRDDILIDDLHDEYLNLFFITTRYALNEQLNVDWIFKTSFIKANHNVGELVQKVTYNNDNLSDFEAYVAEVKPYRTQVREYVSTYTKLDTNYSAITDFDLPPVYENGALSVIETTVIDGKIDINTPALIEYPWKYWTDNVGFVITELRIVDGGAGYQSEPVVRFESASGSGATARAFISNGKVSRIILKSSGSGFLSAPTVIIDGGLSTTGTAARAVAIIGNSVVRSNLVKMKFDRITQNYFITQMQETELFSGTGTKVQFSLTWAPDIRIGRSTVLINGVDELRDNYTMAIVKSTSRGYTSYSGSITFKTAPAIGSIISVTYYKDWSLLNAADRIQYFYNPTTGELGKDLAQLMTGIDYGGVIVRGMNFDIGEGWDSLPFYSDKWDSFDSSVFDDVIKTVDAGTSSFDLGYIPSQGTEVNVYYSNIDAVTYTSDGTTLVYSFSVFVKFPPAVYVTTRKNTSTINNSGQTVLTLANTTGIKVGDIVTIDPINNKKVVGYNTVVKTILSGTQVELDQILFEEVPGSTEVTFERQLIVPTDCIINQNGTVILTEPVTLGSDLTITSSLRPVRIDDPEYGTQDQTNNNAVMTTWIANGTDSVVSFDIDNFIAIFPNGVQSGDKFILRKSTSDGSVAPQTYDYDTALSGGDLAYSTATGLAAEDILVDGDGFITPTTSPAPEEVVPGQVVDSVAIKIFDRPNNGSAIIKVNNYVGDGTTRIFSISQRINSSRAVIVKFAEGVDDELEGSIITSTIKTFTTDYTINYKNSTVTFVTAPAEGIVVSIFSFGFNGSNILDLDNKIGNGAASEIITNAPWVDEFVALVYVDGVPVVEPDIELFKTTTTNSPNRIGIRFSSTPADQALINYIITSGAEQSFSITKTERIVPTGAVTYDLQFKSGNSLPIESSMIVRVDNKILTGPRNSYFVIKNNRLTYNIDTTKFAPYSISVDNIVVLADQVVLVPNQDYIIDLKVISVKINKTTYQQYAGKELIVSVKQDAGYIYVPDTDTTPAKITFSQAYNNDEIIEVISSYNHDILDVQRTAINVTSTSTLTPNTVEYFNYLRIKSGNILLDRTVIDDHYIWVVKNGALLTPSVDFRLNSDRASIMLATSPQTSDEFVLITFGSNVLTAGIAYMQFKDMLNRTHFKRLSQIKQSTLAAELRVNDLSILVEDASTFDTPNPSRNKPGVIEIRGERIEYFRITTEEFTDELGTRTVFVLGQLRRGTLGTGTPSIHKKGAYVQDIGPSETLPYIDHITTEQIISDGTDTIKLSFVPAKTDSFMSFSRLGYNYTGSYSTITSYAKNDVVEYNGYFYVNILGYSAASSQTIDKSPASIIYWKQFTSIPATYGQADDIEVFVGGYNVTEVWEANTSYLTDTIVMVGSYTFRCIEDHTSSSNFRTDYDPNNTANNKWAFFVGNIRLKKVPYSVYDVNKHPESTEGDILLDAEFAVDGATKEIRLTNKLSFGTRVTVIKKTGTSWDSDLNIQYDNSKIAKFLTATPGTWYTGIDKYESITAGTFDSSLGTFDNTTTTFDQG